MVIPSHSVLVVLSSVCLEMIWLHSCMIFWVFFQGLWFSRYNTMWQLCNQRVPRNRLSGRHRSIVSECFFCVYLQHRTLNVTVFFANHVAVTVERLLTKLFCLQWDFLAVRQLCKYGSQHILIFCLSNILLVSGIVIFCFYGSTNVAGLDMQLG